MISSRSLLRFWSPVALSSPSTGPSMEMTRLSVAFSGRMEQEPILQPRGRVKRPRASLPAGWGVIPRLWGTVRRRLSVRPWTMKGQVIKKEGETEL